MLGCCASAAIYLTICLADPANSQATKTFYDSRDDMLRLWCHETLRVLADRMWDPADVDWLRRQLDERLGAAFSTSLPSLFEATNGDVPPYVSFMRPMDPPPYEAADLAAVKVCTVPCVSSCV